MGEHLLSTIWFYAKDPGITGRFYRDQLGLPLIEAEHDRYFHFDAGGVRLSVHPSGSDTSPAGNDGFLVFLVEQGIERVYEQLERRGVRFKGPISDESYGQIAESRDPDGRQLFLWKPPPRESPKFAGVEKLVEHYEKVRNRLQVAQVSK